MGERFWFRCFPTNYLDGVRGLGDELAIAYTRLFMEMYAIGGPVKLDPGKLKYLLEKRPQDVAKIVGRLVAEGKLWVDDQQFIHNLATDRELAMKRKWSGVSASSDQSSPEPSEPEQPSQAKPGKGKKRKENYARAGDHPSDHPRAGSDEDVEEKKEAPLPNGAALLSSPAPLTPQSQNEEVERSADVGSPALEERSPPQPSERVRKGVSGLAAAWQITEDDDDET